jgi:hypothetical protein
LFVRTDCPLTKRYAPELRRIATEFGRNGVSFWTVYVEKNADRRTVQSFQAEYQLPGTVVLDDRHQLADRAHATVSPEAAVFDSSGVLKYHGRIDDQWAEIGKGRPQAQSHDLENAISAVLSHKPVPQPATKAVGCSLADVE